MSIESAENFSSKACSLLELLKFKETYFLEMAKFIVSSLKKNEFCVKSIFSETCDFYISKAKYAF